MDPLPGTINSDLARTSRPVCDTCGFVPPLRSHHCKICNRHVAMFDHHCDFVEKCIGTRNHCRFWWFLAVHALGFWWLARTICSSPYGVVTLLFPQQQHNSSVAQAKALLDIVSEVYVYPLAPAAWIVWGLHPFFALRNSTTFECEKGSRRLEYFKGTSVSDLPYSYSSSAQTLRLFCCQRNTACAYSNNNN